MTSGRAGLERDESYDCGAHMEVRVGSRRRTVLVASGGLEAGLVGSVFLWECRAHSQGRFGRPSFVLGGS